MTCGALLSIRTLRARDPLLANESLDAARTGRTGDSSWSNAPLCSLPTGGSVIPCDPLWAGDSGETCLTSWASGATASRVTRCSEGSCTTSVGCHPRHPRHASSSRTSKWTRRSCDAGSAIYSVISY